MVTEDAVEDRRLGKMAPSETWHLHPADGATWTRGSLRSHDRVDVHFIGAFSGIAEFARAGSTLRFACETFYE
jgi:hypothetical protein